MCLVHPPQSMVLWSISHSCKQGCMDGETVRVELVSQLEHGLKLCALGLPIQSTCSD